MRVRNLYKEEKKKRKKKTNTKTKHRDKQKRERESSTPTVHHRERRATKLASGKIEFFVVWLG
jgi:hypothetical protein